MANRFTHKAQNVLNTALKSASEMGHTYIGSEHLLLGLLSESSGVAAHYLIERGTEPEKIREAIEDLAGVGSPSAVTAADAPISSRMRSAFERSLEQCTITS